MGFQQGARPICPYISSTLPDFQAERDLLITKAFPVLDEICRQRGSYCNPVDLRWDENQVSSGTIFQYCLDSITRACPFFICLLGERYGAFRPKTLPPLPRCYDHLPENADWLDTNFLVAASGGYDWVLQGNYQHYSITELEIVQATQLVEAEHAHFYFRQPDHQDSLFKGLPEKERSKKLRIFEAESEYSNLKVRDLKSRIVKRGLPVRYFKTPEELVDFVIQDWSAVIDKILPKLEKSLYVGSEHFSEAMVHEAFAGTRRNNFVRSFEIEEVCGQISEFAVECTSAQNVEDEYSGEKELFKSNNRRRRKEVEVEVDPAILVLVGDRGSGKTAILANWVKEFAEDHLDVQVVSHYVGASALSLDAGVLMRNFLLRMRGHCQTGLDTVITDTTDACKFYDLSESFRAAMGMGPCVLMVNGIDGVTGAYGYSPQQIKELKWLPQPIPPCCRVVLSTVRSDLTFSVLQQRKDTRMINVPTFTDLDHKVELLEEHLTAYGTSLSEEQSERIASCKLAERPLFLSILASELKVFEVYSRLDHYLDVYLECSSIRELWIMIIQRWISDYSWNVYNPLGEEENSGKGFSGWVADALRLIAVSRGGLTQSQILTILKQIGYYGDREVKSFHWMQFWSSAQEALYEGASGYLNFLHQRLKETVEYKLLEVVSINGSKNQCAVTPDTGLIREPRTRNPVTPSHKVSALMSPFLGNGFAETPRNEPNRKSYHQHLADYFKNLNPCVQRNIELPWQLEMCGNMDDLSSVLSVPQLFLDAYGDKWRHEFRHLELIHFWKVLRADDFDPSKTYRDVIRSLSMKKPKIPTILLNDENYATAPEEEETESEGVGSESSFFDLYAELPSGELNEHVQARLCRAIGMFLAEMGNFDDAQVLLHVAQEKLYENYPLGDDAQMMLCATEEALGNLYKYKEDIPTANKWYRKALRSLGTLMEGLLEGEITNIHHEIKGRILDHLGYIATLEGDNANAESLLKEAETCVLQTGSDAAKATIQYHLGVLRVNRGQFMEAEMLFRQSISTRERWCGKSHLLVAEGLNELAGVLGHPENKISFERYEAEALYRRVLEIREECLGSDHLQIASTLFELGKLLKSEQTNALRSDCLQLLRRSLDIRTTKLGANDPSTVEVRRVLSSLEAGIKPKQKQSPSRKSHQRYTKMTWHDAELLMFEQQAKAKLAEAARLKSMNQMAEDRNRRQMLARNSPIKPPLLRLSDRHTSNSSHISDDDEESIFDDSGEDDDGNGSLLMFERADGKMVDNRPTGSEDIPDVSGEAQSNILSPGQMENANPSGSGLSPRRKPRPRSSYGRRNVNNSAQLPVNHPELKPVPPNSIRCSDPDSKLIPRLPSLTQGQKPVQAKFVLRISRPRTNPNKLYKRYGNSDGSGTGSSVPPQPQRREPVNQTITQLESTGEVKQGRSSSLEASPPPGIYQIHRSKCHIPGPHTNDVHNSYSLTKGPHTTLLSLLGRPPAPRDVFLHIHHTSAWYHVPGRYPTVDNPYPRKRSQQRFIISRKPRLLESGTSSYAEEESSEIQNSPEEDQVSGDSWDSGRNRIAVGAGGGNLISDWMM